MTATSAATAASGVVSAASDARGITIVRVFDAPRELVFDAWTKPEHFVTWFGEHGSEIPLEKCEMDPRPGGAWKATMYHGPERIEIPFSGEFREVEPPNKVSLTLVDPGDPTGPNVELLTAVLRDLGDGRTEMTFTQTGNLPADEYSRAMRGMLIFLDRLADHFAALRQS
ncbi:MAG: SRPBCC domain-containing protein [Chloroflexi bacterium]|nr:MAG: SRPBCC domain-containing protein [Chloroflexota bacterium]